MAEGQPWTPPWRQGCLGCSGPSQGLDQATTTGREHAAFGPEPKPALGNRSRPLRSRLRGVAGGNGADRPQVSTLPTRGASAPTLRFPSAGSEGPSWPRTSLPLAISSPPHPSVWFRPGRGREAGRRGHRAFPLLLRARFVDVSLALALKGTGALPGEATHP